MINAQEWFGTLRDQIDENRPEAEILRQFSEPLILGICDLIPAGRAPSPWNQEMLYRLIDRRYRYLKSTWVTLNVATPDEADEKLNALVFDRLRRNSPGIRPRCSRPATHTAGCTTWPGPWTNSQTSCRPPSRICKRRKLPFALRERMGVKRTARVRFLLECRA